MKHDRKLILLSFLLHLAERVKELLLLVVIGTILVLIILI